MKTMGFIFRLVVLFAFQISYGAEKEIKTLNLLEPTTNSINKKLKQSSATSTKNLLKYNQNTQSITAGIDSMPLEEFLARLSEVTGWNVFIEPGTSHTVSAKFKDRPVGEAMQMLLGNLSFALVPQTNSSPKFFVFKTSMDEATRFIKPAKTETREHNSSLIGDELIVTLKKGENPGDLFKQLGAKVIGKSDSLNSYRLKFDSEESAKKAREILRGNDKVASVSENYLYQTPNDIEGLLLGQLPQMKINPSPENQGKFLVGLIDTPVQKSGTETDSFLLPSVAITGESTAPEDQPTHGTAMAETLLRGLYAALDKSETNIRILPLDAYGKNETTTTFEVALAINAAIENNVKILNLSLGGDGDSEFLHDAVKRAKDAGIIIFAAAGNTPDGTPIYPAAYPEVIAVTAADRKGNILPYANNGDFVDIAAPGTSIIDYRGQSYLVNGTSASSAFAAGIAAAIASEKSKSIDEIEKTIRQILAIHPQNKQNQ
ncbi:MAG: S8 family serine peptidase [Verrucomicrobiae bacterium]|nr:S8 family serine peptidase [Verrucomicrobiae bacterium]